MKHLRDLVYFKINPVSLTLPVTLTSTKVQVVNLALRHEHVCIQVACPGLLAMTHMSTEFFIVW